ncbi:hypothetical protein N752_01025 [Desulforamulus aquiferis]|nr:hypothetical protein [Desulforamulus aquiferis]RYD07197.1 hypothetical protein N752_01025 [Desulforamulus aquiferis]
MKKKYAAILMLVMMFVLLITGTCNAGIADEVKKYANKDAMKQEIEQVSDNTVSLIRQVAGTVAAVFLAIAFFFYKFSNGDSQRIMKAKMAFGGMLVSLFVVFKTELIVGGFLGLLNINL